MNKKGFTLVELLVVVLIVGILSAVALPQYTKAVEKARLTESLVNSKAIVSAAQRYAEMYPESASNDFSKAQIADVNLTGGTWSNSDKTYTTKLFKYDLGKPDGSGTNGVVKVTRIQKGTTLYSYTVDSENRKTIGTDGDAAVKANISKFLEVL